MCHDPLDHFFTPKGRHVTNRKLIRSYTSFVARFVSMRVRREANDDLGHGYVMA